MKVLDLNGLMHYNEILLNKIKSMIDGSVNDCINDVSVSESSLMFLKKDGTSKDIPLTLGDAATVNGFSVSNDTGNCLRPINYGTEALTAGTSTLETGFIYLQYE